MNDLLALIKARLTDLLAGTEYETPGGEAVTPRLYLGALPPKRDQPEQGQDFPFVVIRPLRGADARSDREISIRLICGAYTSDDVEAGVTMINDLTARALRIQQNRAFPPYRLDLPVEWKYGSGDSQLASAQGDQPHPFYFLLIDLRFKAAPIADIKP